MSIDKEKLAVKKDEKKVLVLANCFGAYNHCDLAREFCSKHLN